jgi:Domain of unknown function (DUF4263)
VDIYTIHELIDRAPYPELAAQLAMLANDPDEASIEYLCEFLKYRDDNTYGKQLTPRLVCRALLQKGVKGVQALVNVLPEAPGAIYPQTIVEALWYASRGQLLPLTFMLGGGIETLPEALLREPSVAVAQTAKEAIQDLVVEASGNSELFNTIFNFIHSQTMMLAISGPEAENELRSLVFGIIAESTIRITKQLIHRFSILIEELHSEQEYQQFLTEHPVLIDPLASEVIPKQRLGIEYVTDFVVRRHDRRYILVEIEKPQDRLFNENGDFSARFTHAIGQVLDFQQWVDSNIAYAKRLLPDISSPRGLLVMGRRTVLTDREAEKLHRFCINSVAVDVLTYDDVLTQAINLYESIHRQR